MTDDKGASEAYKQEYGDMEPDHPCVPDVWKNGYNTGRKAEREIAKAQRGQADVVDNSKHLLQRHESLVQDFKQLLFIAQQLCDDPDEDVVDTFSDWKKERGIK